MSANPPEVTVKTTLPPSPVVQLSEPTSPILDASVVEIKQGEGVKVDPVEYKTMTPEQRAKRKAMLVTALERGVVSDRMVVDLPPELHGEWVRRDPMEIEAMKRLGFKVDDEYAKKRALNSDGSNAAIVHDVVFMTTQRENKELIDEVKKEIAYRQSNPRGPQKEETEFIDKTKRGTEGDIPAFSTSKTREVRKGDIEAALTEMATQTQPQL